MTLRTRDVADVTILELDGRFSIDDGVPLVRRAVDEVIGRGRTRLVLGLEKASLVDSSGLGEIVRAHISLTNRRGGLRLLRPTPRTLALLKMLRLQDVLPPYATEEAAIRSFLYGDSQPAR